MYSLSLSSISVSLSVQIAPTLTISKISKSNKFATASIVTLYCLASALIISSVFPRYLN
ncbi:unknown [Firmicutes bacterium CAG:449]|nr:unknown [Firmicutes bacterium CAG:449]